MKKPTHPPPPPPPPPPPLPPRCRSPARSLCSLTHGGGSEYAESVCSMPISTRSRQPMTRSMSPAFSCYHSCRSESAYGTMDQSYCSRPSSCCCSCESRCYPYQAMHYPMSPVVPACREVRSHHSHMNNSINRGHHCSPIPPQAPRHPYQFPLPVENLHRRQLPPKPKERIFRPRLSISPMPELKKEGTCTSMARSKATKTTDTRSHDDRCTSLQYRRHMELYVERLCKYLRDREERRLKCEAEARKHPPTAVQSILTLLAKKESHYLRSLRTRISRADFEDIKRLGFGYMGYVFLVKMIPRDNKPTTKPALYAMKRLEKSQVFRQDHMAHVRAERDILAEADNEWIVKLYYSFQDEKHLYFILEYVPGGDMMNLLSEKGVFPEDWASFYIAEISLALQFVHDMGYIHRDIKPDNILIDAKGHIKLTDFGLCTGFRWTHDSSYYKDDTMNSAEHHNVDEHPTITRQLAEREIEHSLKKRPLSLVGSPNYIAPEVLCRQENAKERLCDWWSVGVILYEMVIGYCPFIDHQLLNEGQYAPWKDPPGNIQMRIVNWRDHLVFPPSSKIHNETKALIKGLLCDPHERLCQNGIQDIQDHPFFLGIDWQTIRSGPAPYVPELTDEYDTRHFDQFSQSFEPENIPESGTTTRMPMNDFTYRSYWQ